MRTAFKIEDVRYFLQRRLGSTNRYFFKKSIKVVDYDRNEFECVCAARTSEKGRIRLFDTSNRPHELSHLSLTSLSKAIMDYEKFEKHIKDLELYDKLENEMKTKLLGNSFKFYVNNTNPQYKYSHKTLAKWCEEGYIKNNLESLKKYYNAVSFCIRLYNLKLRYINGNHNNTAADKYLYYKTLHAIKGNFKYKVIADMWEDAKGDHYMAAEDPYPVWDCNTKHSDYLNCVKEFTEYFILKHGGYAFETIHWLLSNGFELQPCSTDKFLVKFPLEQLQKVRKS